MTVTYVIEFRGAPGHRDQFLALLNGVLDAMRHEDSFRGATLNVDPDDADHYLLHESWADHDEVLTVQLERDYRSAWHEALPVLLAGPRVIGVWRRLRCDNGRAEEGKG